MPQKQQSKAEQIIRLILRKLRAVIYRTIDLFTPYVTHRNYLGYALYYTRGTGLIERIRFLSPKKIYEPELCDAIIKSIEEKRKTKSNPNDAINFFDVGANIGLISLYILRHSPNTQVFAFEPGSRQRAQLETTVCANHLENITVLPYALSFEAGVTSFSTSINDRDVGGDGLIDTGRSHGAKKEIVDTMTLDAFVSSRKVSADIIKIDIEGAELWALKGMINIIENDKPIIFFEMSPLNLEVYPYKADDIINFFTERKYSITNTNGIVCTSSNFEELAAHDDMFIARPL